MAEYIEREAAIRVVNGQSSLTMTRSSLIDSIRKLPAADVAPVRHGLWVKRGCKWQCTNCKVLMSIDGTPKENLLNYCTYCGAKMDGGADR